jgi:hypothetical protein
MRASRAWSAGLALLLLLLTPLTGCQGDARTTEESAPVTLRQRPAPAAGQDGSMREEALALVETREAALRGDDRGAFLATVDPDELGFSSRQARWFDNLALLPVEDVSFELGDEGLLDDLDGDGGLQLPVDFTMRLDGFDAKPVTQEMLWTFVRRDGEVVLAEDHDPEFDERTGWIPAPWDVAHIEVRQKGKILGIFDEDTVDHADYMMSDLAATTATVRQHIPEWTGSFVVYGASDTTALAEMTEMGVDDTAGVAFPVLTHPGGPVAAYRFIVNPTVVGDVLSRGQVFRHELTHVALGPTTGRVPLWLTEGVAQYVARSTYTVEQRRLIAAREMLGADRAALEETRRFYGPNASANYALAGLVCDYIAMTRGEEALWELVRALSSPAGSTDDVLLAELGLTKPQLRDQAMTWVAEGVAQSILSSQS